MRTQYDGVYEFTEALLPLKKYLDKKNVDTWNIKSERQLLYIASKVSGVYVKFPKDRREPLFPQLLKIQKALAAEGKLSYGTK